MVPDRYPEFVATRSRSFSPAASRKRDRRQRVRRILREKLALGLRDKPYRIAPCSPAGRLRRAPAGRARGGAKVLVLPKNEGRVLPLSKMTRRITWPAGTPTTSATRRWLDDHAGRARAARSRRAPAVLQGIRAAVLGGASVTYSRDGSGSRVPTSASWSSASALRGGPRRPHRPVALGRGRGGRPRGASRGASPRSWSSSRAGRSSWARPSATPTRPRRVDARHGGTGVADVLFGDYVPTGKLSHTWPRAMAQVPINWGDPAYDPLYPYGHGLRTEGAAPLKPGGRLRPDAGAGHTQADGDERPEREPTEVRAKGDTHVDTRRHQRPEDLLRHPQAQEHAGGQREETDRGASDNAATRRERASARVRGPRRRSP